VISPAVISRYAHALVDVVLSAASGLKPAEAVEQLRWFNGAVQESPQLRAVLATPAISATRKRAVIKDIANALAVAPVIRNFVLVLSDHHRVAGLPEIVAAFELALDSRLGLVRAEVKSAYELTDGQRAELMKELSAMAGSEVRVRVEVDPDLIGGVSVRLGSKVYDGSVRGQLAELRERLAVTL
jgi:F-type H+-transporting ATPase subunit delta